MSLDYFMLKAFKIGKFIIKSLKILQLKKMGSNKQTKDLIVDKL